MSNFVTLEDIQGHEDLSQEENRALMLLVQGTPVKEVATQVGISARTVYRWIERPDIRALLREYRGGMLRALATTAQSTAEDALKVLADTAKDAQQPLGFRLRAAERLISIAADLTSTVDDGERIDELEKSVRELATQTRAY